jgi:histidine ammonia-lyase
MHILQICSENVNQWLKSSDDNPIINIETEEIISTGNFEVVDLSLLLETLNQSLVHLSRIVFQQIKHLNNDQFTGLPRFLIEQQGSEFGLQTLQKLAMDMDIRIRQLARPVSIEFYGLAGDIEDHNSNLPLIGETTQKINEYLISIIAIELYNAEQAVYLRLKNNKGLSLGTGTKKLYEEVRQLIKPIKEDRKYGFEIEELIRQIKDRI